MGTSFNISHEYVPKIAKFHTNIVTVHQMFISFIYFLYFWKFLVDCIPRKSNAGNDDQMAHLFLTRST